MPLMSADDPGEPRDQNLTTDASAPGLDASLANQVQGVGTRAQRIAWVSYDWGNSAYSLIIAGPLFSPFFINTLLPPLPPQHVDVAKEITTGLVVGSTVIPGSGVIGILTAITAFFVVLTAPVLGALADIRGWAKSLFVTHAILGALLVMSCIVLREGMWVVGAVIFILSGYAFGAALTFYNAFLPKITPPSQQGSLSGWGFGAGYIGGALALILAAKVLGEWLTVPQQLAFAGMWWLVFSIPAFVVLPSLGPSSSAPVGSGMIGQSVRRVLGTFRKIRQYRVLFLFLVAFLLYSNGTDTVINLSPAFGEDVLKMTSDQLVNMFLIVQFVAFLGAVAFGYISDRFGNKVVIVSNLSIWVLAVFLVLLVKTPGQFLWLGIMIGMVMGGVQASSRSLMASLAPKEIHNEAFGFFSLAGRAMSVFGPLMYAGVATAFGPRFGALAVLPFLLSGMILVMFVKEPRRARVDPNPATAAGSP
jgi:UMF1 family MFS transporter